MAVEIRVKPVDSTFRNLLNALNRERDGRELKADLVENLKRAVQPAVMEAQASIFTYNPSNLSPDDDNQSDSHAESLRGAIAAGVESQIVLGGKKAGVSIIAHRLRLRGFWHAPKRLNTGEFVHPVFYRVGRKRVEVTQPGHKDWFDGPIRGNRQVYLKAISDVLGEAVMRIARRARG